MNLSQEEIDESDESKPGSVIDYSEKGNIVGIEILDASKSITFPNKVEV
ncbi:MAG: DUF2283 domain-containing protein [Bacteroidota bacterium]|nr:DUF2283 domain-containing protein [Bacteroidota bacterium]